MFNYIIICIIMLLIIMIIKIINILVEFKRQADNAWYQIDSQIKRRIDLIPNLVEIIKANTTLEEVAFEHLIEARANLMQGGTIIERAQAQSELNSALTTLLATAENYSELTADENFIFLKDELSNAEDSINVSCEKYNTSVQKYNQLIQQVPGNIIANIMGYARKDLFKADEI